MEQAQPEVTVAEAQRIVLDLLQTRPPALRSCWVCNPAHDYLKESEMLCCFVCGHWYYKGLDITGPDEGEE